MEKQDKAIHTDFRHYSFENAELFQRLLEIDQISIKSINIINSK